MRATLQYLLLATLMVAGAWMATSPAAAQSCSFSFSDVDFGAISTAEAGGSTIDTTGVFSASCTGIAGQPIKVCPALGDGAAGAVSAGGQRTMKSGSNAINYQLFSDPSRSILWGSPDWSGTPPAITVMPGQTVNRTVYARYYKSGSSAATGSYTSVFTGGDVRVSYQYENGGNCATPASATATPQPTFTVRAQQTSSCGMTVTGPMDFGSVSTLASNVNATAVVHVTCGLTLLGTTVTIDLGPGNYRSGATRRMARGGEFVNYNLYTDSGRSTTWGSGMGGTTVSATLGFLLNILTGPTQDFTIYGKVPGGQNTPSQGTYTDTVVVTMTY